ncbi:MAG: 30S ribosomal protein S9 [Flavobacteriales bacterium]|nr:30S ribosomal protein S9 [Flavobacteriales bacterium]
MERIAQSGRRKTSVARIYLSKGTGNVTVNGKDYKQYFPNMVLQYKVDQPFLLTGEDKKKYDLVVNVDGGGITGQAEAIRLAVSKALVEINAEYKPALREQGLVTRDPRMVERKKFGRAKARKRFQFSKR